LPGSTRQLLRYESEAFDRIFFLIVPQPFLRGGEACRAGHRGSHNQTVFLWNVETGQAVTAIAHKEFFTLTGHRDGVKSAEFTADGQFVVPTSRDGTARLWPTDPLPLALDRKPRELTAEEMDRFEIKPVAIR
jgi:WD40 repeat protein